MAHTPGTLSRHNQFKEKYADKIAKHLTAASIYQERIPFRQKEMIGEQYVAPVLTRRTTGGNYAASGETQVNFDDIRTSKIDKARMTGTQLFMGDGMNWEAAYSSSHGNQESWTDEWSLVMGSLMDSSRFRIEMATMWGQHAAGSIGTVDGTPAVSATATVTLEAAELAPGILFQLEGHIVEVFAPSLTTQRAGTFEVLTVDPDAGTFTLDNSGGTIVDGDVIFFKGERTTSAWNVQAGLDTWLSNTGTLASISAASNAVWKPNRVSAGGLPMTFDKLLTVTGRLHSRGYAGKLLATVSIGAWNNMMSDMSALVRRTPSEKTYVLGAEAIRFRTGVGEVEVVAHPYQKNGYAHIIPILPTRADGYDEQELEEAPVRRVGATDLIFVGPNGHGGKGERDEWFYRLQRTNLLIAETYSHQALFISCPCYTAQIHTIVNA